MLQPLYLSAIASCSPLTLRLSTGFCYRAAQVYSWWLNKGSRLSWVSTETATGQWGYHRQTETCTQAWVLESTSTLQCNTVEGASALFISFLLEPSFVLISELLLNSVFRLPNAQQKREWRKKLRWPLISRYACAMHRTEVKLQELVNMSQWQVSLCSPYTDLE